MRVRLVMAFLIALAVGVVGVGAAFGAPGDLDATFGGGDGMVTTSIGTSDYGYAGGLDSEGRIVVAGGSYNGSDLDFTVVRYNTDGSLDTSFSSDGIVTTDISTDTDRGRAVAIDSDDRIVLVGESDNGSDYDFAIVRYKADGSLDTSFGGGDGIVTTAIGPEDDRGRAMVIDSAGRIVVAGSTYNGSDDDIAVVRYSTDGSLDTSFGGGDGIVTTAIGGDDDEGHGVAVDSEGRIVVAGRSDNGSDYDFAVVRYTSAGVLDTSFGGGDGIVTTDFGSGSGDYAYAVVVDSAGRIVVFGKSTSDFAVARYTSSGVLDTTFSSDGIVTTDFASDSDYGYGVVLDADGRIVVAGESDNDSGNYDFGVARYNTDGSLDTSFSGDGILTTSVGIGGSSRDYGRAVAIDSDGRIVVFGYADDHTGMYDFAVVRYLGEDSVPAAPTGVVVLSSDGQVAVSWASPSNCWDCVTTTGGAAITDYVVEYSSDSGASWSVFADGTSATAIVMVTGLSNGVGYVFRVSATNSAGTGSVSDSSMSVTPAPVVCTIVGTPGDDVLVGTSGADHICGLGGDDTIYGKGGNDVLDGGPGNDKLYGGTGKDTLYGRGGADVLKGGRNNDKLYGNGGRDRLYGQGGNDRLAGGSNRDRLYGQGGRDKLYGGKARDILVGGAKKDTLDGGTQKDTAKKPGPDVLVSIEIVVP